jgi:gliding-associated putative ABC transporter substrate-binding component GldG
MKTGLVQKGLPFLLMVGIIIALNFLIQPINIRFDLTKNKQYTLSPASKQILGNLKDQITVTAYFSDGLPPDVSKVKRDFQDLLVELSAISKGKMDFKFVSPDSDAIKQEAANNGIQPLMINVREKDQVKQQQAFLGAVIKSGTDTELIPYVQPGASMEYDLVAAIKKLTLQNKPKLAFIQGHGEASFNELSQVIASLSQLYDIQQIDLRSQPLDPDSVKVAVIVGSKTPFNAEELQQLDNYFLSGGSVVLAVNRMEIDMQSAMAIPSQTGLEYWLESKGIRIDTSLVLDVQCGSVTVPQYMGSLQVNTQVQFPYLPLAVTFADHPAVKGMQQVLFPYVSPIDFRATLPQTKFTPLVFSSDKSGRALAPVTLSVGDKKWTQADFPLENQILAGLFEQTNTNGPSSKMIVFGDADFALSNEKGKSVSDMNINLLVNSIDWLGDESGLINLRGKVVASKPIQAKYLLEESSHQIELIKWGNVLLPVLLLLLFGMYTFQRNKRLRNRRMIENFSSSESSETN